MRHCSKGGHNFIQFNTVLEANEFMQHEKCIQNLDVHHYLNQCIKHPSCPEIAILSEFNKKTSCF